MGKLASWWGAGFAFPILISGSILLLAPFELTETFDSYCSINPGSLARAFFWWLLLSKNFLITVPTVPSFCCSCS